MTEGARFELVIPLRVCRLSKAVHSFAFFSESRGYIQNFQTGEGEIRTRDTGKGIPAFQAGALGLYATSPVWKLKE